MGRIVVHEFVSLDGVFENPAWTMGFPYDPRMGEAIAGIMAPASGLLLGRRTFEMFAPAWSTRTAEQDPGAPFMNDSPKHVVSGTLIEAAGWHNSHVLGRYDADAICALKSGAEGDLYVSGSGTLVRAMLADGLVDSLHLFVYPVALGAGERLFTDDAKHMFALTTSDAYDSGVLHLAYRPL
jgi:dihydrofolate reductase